ncbi:hypothetical protein [Aestuariivirga sp.]|uniref:hypothetical protein n=1 Tax=Aestuariivirga sp. TaxID=2650926 RepID=UPI0039E57D97
MTNLKTNDQLLRKMRSAASKSLTAEELRQQKISFIMANFDEESSVTRDYVGAVLDKQDGRKSAA